MKICFAFPGDFHYGMNSLCRGEGVWALKMANILAKNKNNEVCIFGQANKYYRDKDSDIFFYNIYNPPDIVWDIMFSMDPFENCGIEPNWMTPAVSKIKTKKRIFSPFFGSFDHQKCNIPVIYPYYYRETDNKKTFCLPISFGSRDLLNKNNHTLSNAVWFSKNSHENPEYLYFSLQKSIDFIKNRNGKLIIVDGQKLIDNNYLNSKEVQLLINKNKNFVWWSKEWLPFNKMEYVLSKSLFITGIHHPVCNPMQLQIVFNGGIPIIFENQKNLPPYDKTNMPHIRFDSVEHDIEEIYHKIDDPHYYTDWLDSCKNVIIENYTDEIFMEEFKKFMEVTF